MAGTNILTTTGIFCVVEDRDTIEALSGRGFFRTTVKASFEAPSHRPTFFTRHIVALEDA